MNCSTIRNLLCFCNVFARPEYFFDTILTLSVNNRSLTEVLNMANFIIIVDRNPERRIKFIDTVKPLVPPFPELVTNSCMRGNFASLWAAHPGAPISSCNNDNGAAVIWGHAIAHDSTELMNADSIQQQWQPQKSDDTYPTFDGFYAAVVYDPKQGLIIGTDLLGFFPLYYYADREVILIGSSPELFRYHPNFNPQFNPQGLVGLLLLRVLVDNQPLWSNAKRLGAGNLLKWTFNIGAKELNHYRLPCSQENTPYSELSLAEHLDILDGVIDQAIARHISMSKKHNFFLSGGLDSRMLAGFLQRQGIEPVAVTLGKPGDIELECATAVARHLNWEHQVISTPMSEYPFYANFIVNWEHMDGGLGDTTGMFAAAHSYLQNAPNTIINGFSMDQVIGGWKTTDTSFQSLFKIANLRGISPHILSQLLNPEIFGDLVTHTISLLEKEYQSYSEVERYNPWCFSLYHSGRFVLGRMAWALTFGAWPILPILDKKLLETAIALPPATMNNRRGQKELVSTRFPQLAQLPLDRNSWDLEPLKPSATRQKLKSLFKLQQKWRRLQLEFGYDRRYYYQTLNINNPGWQAVRKAAEPYRSKVEHLFNRDVFHQILPPPDVKLKFQSDRIKESSGIKVLLGLLLWSKDHL